MVVYWGWCKHTISNKKANSRQNILLPSVFPVSFRLLFCTFHNGNRVYLDAAAAVTKAGNGGK